MLPMVAQLGGGGGRSPPSLPSFRFHKSAEDLEMVEEEETAAVHDNQNMGEPAVGREPEGVCLHVLLCFSCMFCHSNI